MKSLDPQSTFFSLSLFWSKTAISVPGGCANHSTDGMETSVRPQLFSWCGEGEGQWFCEAAHLPLYCLVAQSCLTAHTWTVARQAPLFMAFPRQQYWVGGCFLLQFYLYLLFISHLSAFSKTTIFEDCIILNWLIFERQMPAPSYDSSTKEYKHMKLLKVVSN